MQQRLPPDDPNEWMNRARSSMNLAYARGDGILYEDLCFQAQQAAEKAIKAIFVDTRIEMSVKLTGNKFLIRF